MRTELIKSLENKYVFFDFDGTLAEFRFFDKVGPSGVTGELLYKFLFEKVYRNIRPLSAMQEVIKNMNPDKVFILGAITVNNEINEKYEWLEKNYPTIKKENIVFVNDAETKLHVLEAFRQKLGVDRQDIVLVDDLHYTVQKAEDLGFIGYHPSSFIE